MRRRRRRRRIRGLPKQKSQINGIYFHVDASRPSAVVLTMWLIRCVLELRGSRNATAASWGLEEYVPVAGGPLQWLLEEPKMPPSKTNLPLFARHPPSPIPMHQVIWQCSLNSTIIARSNKTLPSTQLHSSLITHCAQFKSTC